MSLINRNHFFVAFLFIISILYKQTPVNLSIYLNTFVCLFCSNVSKSFDFPKSELLRLREGLEIYPEGVCVNLKPFWKESTFNTWRSKLCSFFFATTSQVGRRWPAWSAGGQCRVASRIRVRTPWVYEVCCGGARALVVLRNTVWWGYRYTVWRGRRWHHAGVFPA